jgi:3-methyladenine DNA glycosylase Tag
MLTRCAWAPETDPQYLAYHDEEWGVPVHDDLRLFEMLTLEGAQAGLSWSTILNKREGYRAAFAGFDPVEVARFTPAKIERLMQDPSIVRNRLKVTSTVDNAHAVLEVQRDFGSLDTYLGVRRWGSDREPLALAGRDPRRDRYVAHGQRGAEAPGLPVRRPDRLLCVHAGDRDGQRPRGRVLPLPAGLTLRRPSARR